MSDTTKSLDAKESRPEDCVLCDRVLAGFGLLVAVVIAYIAIDIFTGQKLTTMLSGGFRDGDE